MSRPPHRHRQHQYNADASAARPKPSTSSARPSSSSSSSRPPPSAASSSCSCILGPSGSGKTSLAKHLAASNGSRKYYVVNGSSEYPESFHPLTWEEVLSSGTDLSHSSIIFEDLIAVKVSQRGLIKKVVHFLLRRKKIHLYLLAHEVHTTGLYSLLSSMDSIYVSSSAKSLKILRDLQKVLELKSSISGSWLAQHPFHYLKFNLKDRSHTLLGSGFQSCSNSEENENEEKRREVGTFVRCLKDGESMMVIYDLIFRSLSPAALMPKDLCLVRPGGSGSVVHVIDFLSSLRSEERPTKDVRSLKRYLDTKMVLPDMLVLNDRLKRRIVRLSPKGEDVAEVSRKISKKRKKKKKKKTVAEDGEDDDEDYESRSPTRSKRTKRKSAER